MKTYIEYKKKGKIVEFVEKNGMNYIIIDLEGRAIVKDDGLYLIPVDRRHINRTSLGNAINFLNKKGYDFLSEAIYWKGKKDVYFKLKKHDKSNSV